jgi:hypothetical protein
MNKKKTGRDFSTVKKTDVPHGRNGKHKAVVTRLIGNLDRLENGSALKIALTELGDSKENVRSALNRATRKAGRNVATAADREFLYVWNVTD